MVSKRARRICTTETISGFVRLDFPGVLLVCTRIMLDTMHQYGLRSSIQSCTNDSNEQDALEGHWKTSPIRSRILSSPILFREVTTMSKRTLPVWSRILLLPILFRKVTATRKQCLMEQNLSLSKGSWPCVGGGLSCPVPLYFDLEERHCSQ